jgi:VIT1/CCC1 family predicted Fe2+/Mn2+ transporter
VDRPKDNGRRSTKTTRNSAKRKQQNRRIEMSLTNVAGRNLGMLLLGLWLILTGLLPLLSIKVSSTVTTALAVLAIIAGILILLRR